MKSNAYEKNPMILIIDDDEINLMIQKKICERWGYEVVCASDGAIALQLIETIPFDLVISDINLPFVNGFKVSEKLMQTSPELPLLFVTGMSYQEVDKKSTGRDMLQKPVLPMDLKCKIQSMISGPAIRLTA